MGSTRRKSTLEDLFDVLFDLTDIFWRVGTTAVAVLMFASFWTTDWAVDQYLRASTSQYLGPSIQTFGWVFFLLPLMIAALAILFSVKSYQAFNRDHRY